ncbi:MAG TPA: serine/threonine-protein kinase [Acidobacteriota bacterium]|nr:serine/threonine-protein kinase [Acidobacteriota bacterium]
MMDKERFRRIEELFHQVRVLPPEDRATFLDRACGDDLELRAEVDSLLAHSDDDTRQLEIHATPQPHAEAAPHDVEGGDRSQDDPSSPDDRTLSPLPRRGSVPEQPGTRIGPYKILERIGEGGFGTVYMAEQTDPVRRKVALKIIKLGMDTRQVIARFEAERQALALTDHPNIAKVLDAGATESGRPYFVMELVRGMPITEYCDQNKLSARERLELFIPVCRAVQHAHQKGIIHRDIKPSNVLVTLHDGQPVPKIIDFGIAKATKGSLTEKTLFTEFRQFIGTPAYMSPEQAEMSGLDIDTRSDIYSLGVLLYELLTGATPLDSDRLRKAGYGEILRLIRDEEPVTPSVKVSSLGDSARQVATRRRSEPGALSKLFRGDLDWIVLKAMEKDRKRRYQSASELAEDISRHLKNRPVSAGPPSTLYRLTKFVRRHRAAVSAAAVVMLALVAGLTLATAGFLQASRERNAAEQARLEARAEAQRSQAISDFLERILTEIDSHNSGHSGVETEDVIEEAKQLFGENHPTVAAALSSLALQMQNTGRLNAAETLYRESLKIWSTIDESGYNAGVVEGRLGKLLYLSGRDAESEEHLRASIELFSDLPEGAGLAFCEPRIALGELLNRRGQSEEAIRQFSEALRIRQELAPEQRYEIAVVRELIIQSLATSERLEEAAEMTLSLARDYQALFPGGLIEGVTFMKAGSLFQRVDRLQEAEECLSRGLMLLERSDPKPYDLMLFAMDGLFQIVRKDGDRKDETLQLAKRIVPLLERNFGAQSMQMASQYMALSSLASGSNQMDWALETALRAHRIVSAKAEKDGGHQGGLRRIRQHIGRLGWQMALDEAQAQTSQEEAHQALELLISEEPNEQNFQQTLGVLAYRIGNDEAALEHLSTSQELRRASELGDSPYAEAYMALASARLGRLEESRHHLSSLRHLLSMPIHAADPLTQGLLAQTEKQLDRLSQLP